MTNNGRPSSLRLTLPGVEQAITNAGFTLRYVEYCEDNHTPGLLGQIRGVTDWERGEVKISLKANPNPGDLYETLTHELRHIQDPTWDCGNRDVFGRGGN